jgi:hypothetical protein
MDWLSTLPAEKLIACAAGAVAALWLFSRYRRGAERPPSPPPVAWVERDRPFVVLHQFPVALRREKGHFSSSPFCAKVEAFLLMHSIPHEVRNSLSTHGRTGKMPWIELYRPGKAAIVVPDSSQILALLASEFGIASTLSTAESAIAHLLQRTLEEHMYWALVRTRWGQGSVSRAFLARHYFNCPPFIAGVIVYMADMKKTLWGQGTGRYTEAELVARLEADAAAITQLLAGRAKHHFLFNSATPNPIDASAFALLDAISFDWEGNFLNTPRIITPKISEYLQDVRAALRL